MWKRSLSLRVSSIARLPTADEMKPLIASGLVIDVLTLASTARKKESCRWMRLKSESPSYSQWPLLFTYWRCRERTSWSDVVPLITWHPGVVTSSPV